MHFRRAVIRFLTQHKAWHVVVDLKTTVFGIEDGLENGSVLDITLVDLQRVDSLNLKKTAAVSIEQPGKDGGGIKKRQTEPIDAGIPGYQGCARAIAD